MASEQKDIPAVEETDEQRKIRLLEERLKAAENKAEEAVNKLKEVDGKIKEADEKIKEADEKRKEADEKRKEAEEQRDELIVKVDASPFRPLLRLAEEDLFSKLVVEKDPSLVTKPGTTKVFGKLVPATLRRWEAFPVLHAARFQDLENTFRDRKLFASIIQMEYVSRRISPHALRNENELRSFIRIAIEGPAREILQQYYQDIRDPNIYRVTFRDTASGLRKQEDGADERDTASETAEEDAERPAKRQRSSSTQASSTQAEPEPLPDRWGIRIDPERNETNCFVGECKAAHNLKPDTIRRVLGTHPGDNFFGGVLQRKTIRAQSRAGSEGSTRSQSPDSQSAAAESAIWGEVLVAMVLCQAFDYMIRSRLAFGYIASGAALIFLYVAEDDPTTLSYFPVLFPKLARAEDVRPVEQTAVAYLTTFCMMAAEGTQRSAQWVDEARGLLDKWPRPKAEPAEAPKRTKSRLSHVTMAGCDDRPLPHRPHDDAGDGDGGDGGGHSGPGPAPTNEPARGRSPAKRRISALEPAGPSGPGSTGTTKTMATTFQPAQPRPPTLPFCTLACLAGLRVGARLDPRCPNVALHAAVAVAASPRAAKDAQLHHGLTAAALCQAIQAQLARHLEDNCECWDWRGYYGATAAMFKLTLAGTGYTFVGKGVQSAHRHKLENEAALYGQLSALQGSAIPVCLGLVRLVRPFALSSLAEITDMLLLAWAGWTLDEFDGDDPLLEAAAMETEDELLQAGLWDDDGFMPNLTWNEEQRRVMRIDLGESWLCKAVEIRPRGTKRQHDEAEDQWAPKRRRRHRVW